VKSTCLTAIFHSERMFGGLTLFIEVYQASKVSDHVYVLVCGIDFVSDFLIGFWNYSYGVVVFVSNFTISRILHDQ